MRADRSPADDALLRGSSNTVRFLFDHGFYSNPLTPFISGDFGSALSLQDPLVRWLWKRAPLFYDDIETKELRLGILFKTWECMAGAGHLDLCGLPHFLATDRTNLLQALISTVSLRMVFKSPRHGCYDSFEKGKIWLRFLSELGVDIGDYLGEQVKRYTHRSLGTYLIFDSGSNYHLPRRLLIDCSIYNEWSLGWEWVFDAQSPGYLVVSEFSAIATAEIDTLHFWPFSDTVYDWSFEVEERLWRIGERFDHKLAKKTQKELRWARKRMPRSKMPGSWI